MNFLLFRLYLLGDMKEKLISKNEKKAEYAKWETVKLESLLEVTLRYLHCVNPVGLRNVWGDGGLKSTNYTNENEMKQIGEKKR